MLNKIGGVFVSVLFGVPAFAQSDQCRWMETDRLAASLCECREIESDIERLQCFEKVSRTDMLLRRQADARAEWLSRQPFGIEAMRDRTSSEAN